MSERNAGRKENRLAGESSPYLQLHRHNPVDWYPWAEEALERAREEDRPIFLSVGYSTCYWCHVMERESFSDPAIAELMNREFVNVKLDREERPDLDEVYMAATQILTQHGGWPNSVFLTPELKPFYAGTYFPPQDRQGMPGFPKVLRSLAEAWRSRRAEVEEQAQSLADAMRRYLEERVAPGSEMPSPDLAERSLADLKGRFDAIHGGFGGAPKFPTPSNLYLLAELADARPEAAEMLGATLERMARGGIYDQLGGGFHRYATDAAWLVPHFEKMLYDNGFLVELYARQAARTGDPEMARTASEIAAWLAAEMTSPEGAFWSAQDAETDGDEGAYYVWRREELREILGEEQFGFLAPIYGFDRDPFFEGGRHVLHLPGPLAEQAVRRRVSRGELLQQIEPLRRRLLTARRRRQAPLVDDKILADWNGIAIAGLATAGRLLDDRPMIDQAAAAARFILDTMHPAGGTLLHAWRAGKGRIPAFLADYAHVVRGCLALHRATGDPDWLRHAGELADEQEERLGDVDGGYWGAAESADLLFRSKEVFDGATPGANAVAILNLLELGERTGEARRTARARATLGQFGALADRHPEAVRMMAVAAHRFARSASEPPPQSASASSPDDPIEVQIEIGSPDSGGWRPLSLRLEIGRGWHLVAAGAAGESLRPTRIRGVGLELDEVVYPPGQQLVLAAGAEPIPVYRDVVEITGRLRPAGDSPQLRLAYQACDDRRCLAPVERSFAVGR